MIGLTILSLYNAVRYYENLLFIFTVMKKKHNQHISTGLILKVKDLLVIYGLVTPDI